MALVVKKPSVKCRRCTLGLGDYLEQEVATHYRTLAWEILWTEEPGRLQSMGSKTVAHD